MIKKKAHITVFPKPIVVLLEQDITRKNGFELADQTQSMFETRKIPILVFSDFVKDIKK